METVCNNARSINQSLFKRGASFRRPTLWIYGKEDNFYSLAHSLKNFDAYKTAGGTGEFFIVSLPGKRNGHWAMSAPNIWTEALDKYLNDLSTFK